MFRSAHRRRPFAPGAPRALLVGLLVGLLAVTAGCGLLSQVTALRRVDFTIDRASNVRLAGVLLDDVRSFGDLGAVEAGRIALAVGRQEVPLEFDLHVLAENPEDNPTARMMHMDWTLLLEERETVSGSFEQDVALPPGETQDVPIPISLDAYEFFASNARDLVELALSLTGQGGRPKDVALRATPVVDTPLGPIRYPEPITIYSGELGGGGTR